MGRSVVDDPSSPPTLPSAPPATASTPTSGVAVIGGDHVSESPSDRRQMRPAGVTITSEQPSTFELVINLKVAKSLGLAIPQLLLLQADQVIQ